MVGLCEWVFDIWLVEKEVTCEGQATLKFLVEETKMVQETMKSLCVRSQHRGSERYRGSRTSATRVISPNDNCETAQTTSPSLSLTLTNSKMRQGSK